MKKLFARVKTKAELTEYLTSKTLEKGRQSGKSVVVAWSCHCEATHMHLKSLTFVIRVGLVQQTDQFLDPSNNTLCWVLRRSKVSECGDAVVIST